MGAQDEYIHFEFRREKIIREGRSGAFRNGGQRGFSPSPAEHLGVQLHAGGIAGVRGDRYRA
uniref:Uncharacterized protein n=1 Tax=Anguilla anguilla TaxID=7936 RepID=A0A0E9VTX5_ANGAN